ncbi:hypothetical protein DHEL01_v212697 [Diaporthe helianthi]|uniref:Uncharacterized protein n=1 Tax=Diaporthe helianthi TaxID=158607 RepID=A0A2P5HF70_DIAHE|nr:hypothetical protein DHEL01_v212697 [Diaporthe helianthi]
MSNDGFENVFLNDGEDDTFSAELAFDMPEYKLHGLRIHVGPRRESSVDGDDPINMASESRCEWKVVEDDNTDIAEFEEQQRDALGFDRSFIHPEGAIANQMGQAIDLAIRMIETQKSIDSMAGVAQRVAAACPGETYQHILTPHTTWEQIQTLVRAWTAKLRQVEFFKIQLLPTEYINGNDSGVIQRSWPRFTYITRHLHPEFATITDYKPHYAGMLRIDVKVGWMAIIYRYFRLCDRASSRSQIVQKLVHHASSSHPDSGAERQKCLFRVANLIINQVQRFWVGFLLRDEIGDEPFAVYTEATEGLYDLYDSVNAGYHWDVEFFGGVIGMGHNIHNPSTDFNQDGGFGRNLSIGVAFLNRPDGSEQLILDDSITRCTAYDFSDVCRNGLRVIGPRVPALGFSFIDYTDGA